MIKDLKNIFVLDGLRAKLLLIICCVICYVNVVKNDYALDDDFAFYNNQYVQMGVKGIPDILTHPYYSDRNLTFDYRPVASITFAIEKELFGNNPHISHGINLFFYIICVLMVLGLLTEVFGLNIVPAFLTALFFAIHPAHIEVVASIKNREELLSFIFCLLALFSIYRFFLQPTPKGRFVYLLFTIICLLLSFASKLTSIPIFGIVAVWLYFKEWHRQPKLFYPVLGVIGIVSALYMMKILSISNRPIFDLENPLALYTDLSSKIGTTAASLLFYFRFMWVPYPFSFFYGYNTIPVAHIEDPVAVLSIFLHLAILVYAVILFFRKDISGFFVIAYFISVSVYSNILMPYTGIVSERALFFPSLWFIAAACNFVYNKVTAISEKTSNTPKIALMSFASILLTVYGVLDINRVSQWHDTVTLMGSDVKHLSNSALANYFYGCVLKSKAEEQVDTAAQNRYLAESKKYLYVTSSVSPGYPYTYFRLGLIYRYDRYTPDSAYYYFKKAYTLNATLTEVAYQYGRTEYEFGDMKIASDVFADLYQKIPGDTFTVFYHALLLMKTGHPAEGHQINAVMMQMAPTYYQSYFNEALYYQMTGDTDNAAKNYETSVRFGCTDQTAYRYLIDYYLKQGRTDDANRLRKLLL